MKRLLTILLIVLVLGTCCAAEANARKKTTHKARTTAVVKDNPEVEKVLKEMERLLNKAKSNNIDYDNFEAYVLEVAQQFQKFEALRDKASKSQKKRYKTMYDEFCNGIIAS